MNKAVVDAITLISSKLPTSANLTQTINSIVGSAEVQLTNAAVGAAQVVDGFLKYAGGKEQNKWGQTRYWLLC